MICRNSATFVRIAHYRKHNRFHPVLILIFLACIPALATMVTHTNFNLVGTPDRVTAGDSIYLSSNHLSITHLLSDSSVNGRSLHSRTASLISLGNEQFSVFYSESLSGPGNLDNVYKRSVTLRQKSVDISASSIMFNSANAQISFLEAAQGTGVSLVTFLNGTLDPLYAVTESTTTVVSNGITAFGSLCNVSGSLFYRVSMCNNVYITLTRITATPAGISVLGVDTLAQQFTGAGFTEALVNPSVAVDSLGLTLVLFTRKRTSSGGPPSTNKIDYTLLSAARAKLDSGMVRSNVGEPDTVLFWKDAPVVSYGRSKFAAVNWHKDSLFLHTFSWNGASMSLASRKIAVSTPCRQAAITATPGYLVAAVKADLDHDAKVEIWGIRFKITGGVIAASAFDTIRMSGAATVVPYNQRYYAPLSLAADSSGAMAVAWPGLTRAYMSICAPRPILNTYGIFAGNTVPVKNDSTDTVVFFPSTHLKGGLGYGAIRDSLQFGKVADTLQSSLWSPWISAQDSLALFLNSNAWKYCRYRVALVRGADSLNSPSLYDYTLRWDVKPVIARLDSVRIGRLTRTNVAFGDTLTVLARVDSVKAYYRLRDGDIRDTLQVRTVFTSAHDTAVGISLTARVKSIFGPPLQSDSVFIFSAQVTDSMGMKAQPKNFYVRSANVAPRLTVILAKDTTGDGLVDSARVTVSRSLIIQQSDSVDLVYSVADTNDPTAKVYLYINGIRRDSAGVLVKKTFRIRGRDLPFAQCHIAAWDGDDSTTLDILVGVNHRPRIQGVTFGSHTSTASDSVAVTIGAATRVTVMVQDSERTQWDSVLTYRYTTSRLSVLGTDSFFTCVPARADSFLRITVVDRFGLADSLELAYSYPWLSLDAQGNPGLAAQKDTLAHHLSFIVGGSTTDTIKLPYVNTGNDTVSILGMQFSRGKQVWRTVGIPQGASRVWRDSAFNAPAMSPVFLPPGDTMYVWVRLNLAGFTGDSLLRDTLFLATADPVHPVDTIVLQAEYNDLPRLLAMSFNFRSNQPYWLAKQSAVPVYTFPPYATISLTFSEPIDTASAALALSAYSILDSIDTQGAVRIPFSRSWSGNGTVLSLSPRYAQPSPHFFNLLPRPGFFIPTDSLALTLTSALTDRAHTPSGPNHLDVNRDYQRDVNSDTTFFARVDSIHFVIAKVFPESAAVEVPTNTPIKIRFSQVPYPGTLTAKSLVVTSQYYPDTIPFDSVRLHGDTAVFYPARSFFFGDSVRCYYRAVTVRDSAGYPADVTGDGLPITLFDSLSIRDDKIWYFHITGNSYDSLYPAPGARGIAPATPVVLSFRALLAPGVIDTALHLNSSLVITSRYNGSGQFDYDSIRIQQNKAYFYPRKRFYFEDSVICNFRGFQTQDSGTYFVNPQGASIQSDGTVTWGFSIRTMRLVAISPDSLSTAADLKMPIILTFADKVYPGSVDFTRSGASRSLAVTTRYSEGVPLVFSSFTISSDSLRIIAVPDSAYFGFDSIRVNFSGLSRIFSYDSAHNYPLAQEHGMAAATWYFTTGDLGFYTWPNPYKPGQDSRYCGALGSPCGIWFKNLHCLTRRALTQVKIRVTDMSGFSVYDTDKKSVVISFSEHAGGKKPEWLWDTRNNKGELTASGLYFYIITDPAGKLLVKGKLLIVR